MALTKDDLNQIKGIVTEVVGTSEERVISRINREINDLSLVVQTALNKLDNHETRLLRVEDHLNLVSAKH